MLFEPAAFAGGSINTTTLNTTNDWMAYVFYWPGGDLTKCAFYCSAATGSPVVTVQLFNVDNTDATTTPVNTGSAIGSAVDSATLTAAAPITVSGIGQTALAAGIYALRLIFKSGTSCVIARFYTGSGLWGTQGTQLPCMVNVDNGGAQTKASANGIMLALGGSTFVPVPGCMPPVVHTSQAFQDINNPDEYGLWFANPFPVSIRIAGVVWYNISNNRPNIRVAYYTGTLASPTAAFSVTLDRDPLTSATNGGSYLGFSTKQILLPDAIAGIGFRSTTSNNQSICFWDFLTGNEALMDMWWGRDATLFSREADTGALTQTTYRTPMIFPVIDGVDSIGPRANYGMGI